MSGIVMNDGLKEGRRKWSWSTRHGCMSSSRDSKSGPPNTPFTTSREIMHNVEVNGLRVFCSSCTLTVVCLNPVTVWIECPTWCSHGIFCLNTASYPARGIFLRIYYTCWYNKLKSLYRQWYNILKELLACTVLYTLTQQLACTKNTQPGDDLQ